MNTSILDQSKRRNNEINKQRNVLRNDIKQAWKNKATRRFIWSILEDCGLYNENIEGNTYLEGRRSMGLLILQRLEEVNPLAYANLIIEMDKERNDA